MSYLLGTQALIDSAKNERTAVHDWVDRVDPTEDEVHVSVVSFMVFQSHIDQSSPEKRLVWQKLFNAALIKHKPDDLITVKFDIAMQVAHLRALSLTDDARAPLGDSTLLVLATALEEHLMLVDRRRNYHAQLEQNYGLLFDDPYA